jgi:hypothetical protein
MFAQQSQTQISSLRHLSSGRFRTSDSLIELDKPKINLFKILTRYTGLQALEDALATACGHFASLNELLASNCRGNERNPIEH